jgi:hypothetical protein
MAIRTPKRRRPLLRPLKIEISQREILDDLLYPASRDRAHRSPERTRRR